MEELIMRRQPYSAEAEQAVLGSILIDPGCMHSAVNLISPDDFYVPENKTIFQTLYDMVAEGGTIDPVVLLENLKQSGIYDEAGGRNYLYKLMETTPTSANMSAYAEIVKGKAKLRRLIDVTSDTTEKAFTEKGEVLDLIATLEQQLYELRGDRSGKGLVHIKDALDESNTHLNELVKNKGKLPGVPTGFSDLDYYITGLNNSDLVLLAARPGVGKTSVALNIARHASAHTEKSIAIFNLEMSRVQLVQRMLSSESMVDLRKIRTVEMDDDEWHRLAKAMALLSKLNIYIDDTATITVPEIKSRARRLSDVGLVVIDYLQLISSNRRDGNRVQEVSEISRALKIMAKELDVPVLCCSQLSRAPTTRKGEDAKPRLSDLRDSGAIEQDADIVLFLYKDEDPEAVSKSEIDCIIAKNRNGQTGTVKFHWLGQFTRFTSQDHTHTPQGS